MEQLAAQELQARLQLLRPVLLSEGGKSFLDLFDQFLEHREYGLALHVVCDYMLAPHSPTVSQSSLDQIEHLHTSMKIDDHCVQELKDHQPT